MLGECTLRIVILVSILSTFGQVPYASASICVGKHYVMPSDVLKRNISKIEFKQFSTQPQVASFENNGQTVVVKYTYERARPTLLLGPFGREEYQFEFMYFNWLNSSSTKKGEFPAELHLVFRNKRFSDLDKALTEDLAVVVASFRQQIVDGEKSSVISIFYDHMDDIPEPNSIFEVEAPITAGLFRVANFGGEYHLYRGKSLIPGSSTCSADVLWLDYVDALRIHTYHVEILTNLVSFSGVPLMTKTFASIPPNGTIYYAIDDNWYRQNNWTAPQFEGLTFPFNSAPGIGIQALTLYLLIMVNYLHILLK